MKAGSVRGLTYDPSRPCRESPYPYLCPCCFNKKIEQIELQALNVHIKQFHKIESTSPPFVLRTKTARKLMERMYPSISGR
jgi:hypothetical protein